MKTGADSKIWVVLPAYNEESALPTLLDSLLENLGQKGEEFSIIVVNDGSEDRTGEVAEDYARRAPVSVLHNDGNKGLAETMRRGLMEAVNNANGKDTIVTMDADNTHRAGLALNMVRSIRKGDDIVIASRYRKGSQVHGVSFYRRALSMVASWLCRMLFPIAGCAITRAAIALIARMSSKRWLIATEANSFLSAAFRACSIFFCDCANAILWLAKFRWFCAMISSQAARRCESWKRSLIR